MNVAVVNAVYPPEPVVSAQLGADLASELNRRGAKVRVICPMPSRPVNHLYPQFTARTPLRRFMNGIDVLRLPSVRSPGPNLMGRLAESATFGVGTAVVLFGEAPAPAVLYQNTWPMFAQLFTSIAARAFGIPYVLHVQDIYPEALTSRVSVIFRRMLEPPLRALDGWIARNAATVVVVSDSMRRTYMSDRHVPAQRIEVCPNWVDDRGFAVNVSRTATAARYGVPADRFTFMYLGNIGQTAGVDILIRAFSEAGLTNAQLLIVGDGVEKARCVELTRKLSIRHVQFISDPEARNVPELQSMADVFLLPLRRNVGSTSIPSKFVSYLLSGKPVLATVASNADIARYIKATDCGWVGDPEDVEWLASHMKMAATLPRSKIAKMGAAARTLADVSFSRSRSLPMLADIVLRAGSGHACVI